MSTTPPIDYNALATQAGAISTKPGAAVDYAALAARAGAIKSAPPATHTNAAPPTPEQPGFLQRLGQSLGLPTSQAELDAQTPTSIGDALSKAASASTGLLTPIANYAKTAIQGIREGGQDVQEAAENVAQGQPIGANAGKAASGVLHAALQATPIVGPSIDTAGQDVASGNIAGAAGGLTGVIGQIAAPKIIEGAGKVVDGLTAPEQPAVIPETPKAVSTPVTVDTPLEDSVIRKFAGGKELSADARDTLRQAAGDTVQEGNSVENHMLGAVKPINAEITTQGQALSKILDDAGQLSDSPKATVTSAIEDLRDNLPGGTNFDAALDKELTRAGKVLDSTSPTEINDYVRELDKRISSYNAPEEPIDTAANAADAARVTIRRALRDTLNTEIPETAPVNDVLGNALEVRSMLRKKFGDVAYDSDAAQKQYSSELREGQQTLANDRANQAAQENFANRSKQVSRNRQIAGGVAVTAGLGAAGHKVLSLIP